MSKKKKRLFKLFQANGIQRNDYEKHLETWEGFTYDEIISHYENVTIQSIQTGIFCEHGLKSLIGALGAIKIPTETLEELSKKSLEIIQGKEE